MTARRSGTIAQNIIGHWRLAGGAIRNLDELITGIIPDHLGTVGLVWRYPVQQVEETHGILNAFPFQFPQLPGKKWTGTSGEFS